MENISKEESFNTSYKAFLNAIKTLSKSAEKQCDIMGDFNVAYEIKDDISAGVYLINNKESFLTNNQKLAIEQLIIETNKVPESVLRFTDTKEESLKSMRHSCWEPLRKHALIVIRTLESATIKNDDYFK